MKNNKEKQAKQIISTWVKMSYPSDKEISKKLGYSLNIVSRTIANYLKSKKVKDHSIVSISDNKVSDLIAKLQNWI